MDRRRFIRAAASVPVAVAAAGVEGATMESRKQPDYLEHVSLLIHDWRRLDIESVLARVTDDIVWHSHVGSPPVLGKAAMRQMLGTLSAQMSDVKWRIFDYAERENRVFLEGVDDFVTGEGRRVVIPYAGVLAFRGNLVSEWRDYFDRGVFNRLKSGEPMPDHLQSLASRTALF